MKKIIIPIAIFIAAIFCAWSQETVPQTQTILKSYFATGDRPSYTNYATLIDTMFWYINQTYSNSLQAAASAQNSTVVYQAYAGFTLNTSTGVAVTIGNANNVSSLTVTATGSSVPLPTWSGGSVSSANYASYQCVLTFSNQLAGNNYRLLVSSPGCVTNFNSSSYTLGVYAQGLSGTNGGDLGTSIPLMSKSATNCVFYLFTVSSANLNGMSGAIIIQ